ncbi:MAG TPA: MFS transporter [Thermoplasmata archaeon]|nr:MFS transporter [Thermoplasmata archaeon]
MEPKYRTLTVVGLGVFMAVADASIIALAIPAISREFASSVALVAWVFISYLVTVVALLIILGRLADMKGRKRVYLASFWVFIIGSVGCGLAPSLPLLIAMRVVQGVGAAGLITNFAAILVAAFPAAERGRAIGLSGIFVSGAAIAGQPIGGVLVELLSWRWAFFINLPIGIGAVLLGTKWLEESPLRPGQRFDVPGALMLAGTLLAGTFALTFGVEFGWTHPLVLASGAAALVLFPFLLHYESRVDQPVLDLSFFRIRVFALGNASGIFSFIALFALLLLVPVYASLVLGLSPGAVGLILMVQTITLPILGPLSGHISDRQGPRLLCVVGMATMAASMLSFVTLSETTAPWEIAWRLALFGVGMALFQSPNNSAMMGAVPPARLGAGSGMITTVRNVGIAIGTALPVTLLAVLYAAQTGAPPSLDPGAVLDKAAFVGALRQTYFFLGVMCAGATLIAAMRE